MGKDDDMMMFLILGVALVGGIFIFGPSLLGGSISGEPSQIPITDIGLEDTQLDSGCGVSETRFLNYYADRASEELDRWSKKGVNRDTKLEIKGRVLLSYKNNIRKIYEINQGCIVPLEGEAKAIFVDILLKAADRFDIRVPSQTKEGWKVIINEELNKARTARLIRSRHVTKISVL